MRFQEPLVEGKLVRRYKRFLADVKLRNGDEITVHCANSGSMSGLSAPGSKVLISRTNDPRRKFDHQLEIVYAGRTPVGIHTGRPITVTAEAIMAGKIPALAGYAQLRRLPPDTRTPGVHLILEGNGLRNCYIAVENVVLEKDGVAQFPDSKNAKGITIVKHLTNLVREGNRAMLVFVAQRGDVTSVALAEHLDNDYSESLRDAVARGVEHWSFRAKVNRKGIEFDRELEITLN